MTRRAGRSLHEGLELRHRIEGIRGGRWSGAVRTLEVGGAKRTLDRLAIVGQNKPQVRRDGVSQQIPPDEVVLGDIVELGPGDQIVVDGETLGSARVDAEGNFTFIQPFDLPQDSAVQGEAVVDLENDPALQVAYEEVLEVSRVAQE